MEQCTEIGWVDTINTNVGSFLFREQEFSGMVGETVTFLAAYQIVGTLNKLALIPIDYEEMKEKYRSIKGKKERIAFNRWMRQFSPASIKARLEAEAADAIRRVI